MHVVLENTNWIFCRKHALPRAGSERFTFACVHLPADDVFVMMVEEQVKWKSY